MKLPQHPGIVEVGAGTMRAEEIGMLFLNFGSEAFRAEGGKALIKLCWKEHVTFKSGPK